ncbi:unnamed protein product [Prorocentrum cordatum]|uniref:PB1 domain-containing protein n=1 Tax=Prorocentrum cordatum TaxID=2364126 RepID=A0ABN9TBQ7_9DINO|nr:unnamed protein product [Polarella glacialis]
MADEVTRRAAAARSALDILQNSDARRGAASTAQTSRAGRVRLFARVATLDGLLAEASARFGVPLRPRLTYRDTEGDELTVTTSEELLLALGAAAASGGRAPLLEAERADEDGLGVCGRRRGVIDQPEPATGVRHFADPDRERPGALGAESGAVEDAGGLPRNDLGLTGTKVACGEGGCGSCVVSATGPGGPVVSLNSCLRPLCAMDGWSVTTVEGLKGSAAAAAGGQGCCRGAAGAAHPIQQKLADGDGVQCGFCSPGWVMSMYALLEKGGSTTLEEIEQHCDGNLCRCTGYRCFLLGGAAVV